jgi:hypothetical protein
VAISAPKSTLITLLLLSLAALPEADLFLSEQELIIKELVIKARIREFFLYDIFTP